VTVRDALPWPLPSTATVTYTACCAIARPAADPAAVTRQPGASPAATSRSRRGDHRLKDAMLPVAFTSLGDPASRTLYNPHRGRGEHPNAALIRPARGHDVIFGHAPHPPALPVRPPRPGPGGLTSPTMPPARGETPTGLDKLDRTPGKARDSRFQSREATATIEELHLYPRWPGRQGTSRTWVVETADARALRSTIASYAWTRSARHARNPQLGDDLLDGHQLIPRACHAWLLPSRPAARRALLDWSIAAAGRLVP
jgi:hypothetical protein